MNEQLLYQGIKKYYKRSRFFFTIGLVFWAIETAYFLIKYGWHIKACNAAERLCDGLVTILWGVGLYFVVCTLESVVQLIIKAGDDD